MSRTEAVVVTEVRHREASCCAWRPSARLWSVTGCVRGAASLTGPVPVLCFPIGLVWFEFFSAYLEPYFTADLVRTVFHSFFARCRWSC